MNIQKQQRNWVSFLGLSVVKVWNLWISLKVLMIFSDPKPETMEILKNRLKNEIELYNFVKDLFYDKLKYFTAKLNSKV